MKLWLLRPIKDLPEGDDPWERHYDMVYGFVIRAKNEQQAREMAIQEGGDEVRETRRFVPTIPWNDSKYSSCVELTNMGKAEIIINDFNAG